MDTEALIIIAVIVGIAFIIYLTIRRPSSKSRCLQCGRPIKHNLKECPFCHASLDPYQTFFPRLPTIHLAFIGGSQSGQVVALKDEQIQIGRNPQCQICIQDSLVSWNHAILAFSSGQYVLYDQDSTNGTWVNGQRIAQYAVQLDKDQIQIGPAIFVLRNSQQQQALPSPLLFPQNEAKMEKVYAFGDYQCMETLGGGGAATVYRAISKQDQQVVAIKVLHQSDDPYLRDKFKKEGSDIAQMLRHPHIVRVYGGGDSQGVLYLVMELMKGGTLRDLMVAGRPLPLDQTITIIGQMCDALQYAHIHGVYHRDIKPENIFLTAEGQAKLGDFGIARLAQAVTRTASGWLLGTPSYMSFEQAKGHNIDGRSDLYSLGIVLYEIVTGRCPFVADNPLQVVDMHIQARPTPPSKINPNVPPAVEKVILRALEKDRERRFHTAEEMARALGYAAPMHGDGQATPAPMQQRTVGGSTYQQVNQIGYVPPQGKASSKTSHHLALVRSDGMQIPLDTEIVLLNRENINPGDAEISRQHARIVRRSTYYWIEDPGSANGTFVNRLRVFSPQLLRPGDEIRLGHTVLRVVG